MELLAPSPFDSFYIELSFNRLEKLGVNYFMDEALFLSE